MTAITTGEEPVVRIAGGEPADPDHDARVVAVGPTGVPAVEPLVAVTRDGRTAFYARCDPERVDEIASSLGEDVDPDAVVEHDPETTDLPVPDLPGLRTGDRAVLGACGWRRPTSAADHAAAGGFDDPDPEAVLSAGETLRGRGWGDLCHDEWLGETWARVSEGADGGAVVVNGHGNPGDALLLASAPFEVLDGATALAEAVGAAEVVVYVSEDDADAVATAREAVANHPDPSVSVAYEVVGGPPAYRAAEPTMAIEAVEGNHRLEARLRPPGPEEVGLHGRPTLVHTPRTLAALAVGLRTGADPWTRVVTVTGDVESRATVELPESGSLAAALDAVSTTGDLKAACVGGRFGGVTRDLEVGVDPAALADAGLGTEGTVHLLSDDRCVVEFVGQRAQFAADENCGRCVPCREGTTQLAALLRDVYEGSYDPDGMTELVRVMETSSICAFGVEAGRPARTALEAFESEFEAHADGRCPSGACLDPLEAS